MCELSVHSIFNIFMACVQFWCTFNTVNDNSLIILKFSQILNFSNVQSVKLKNSTVFHNLCGF